MTTYYVRTDGNDGNAGTTDSSGGAWLTLAHAASVVTAGDVVMIRAAAGNAASYPTSSLDYSEASHIDFSSIAGSVANGHIKWIGYNGMPTIGSTGLIWYNCTMHWLENLYFVATAGNNPGLGILNTRFLCVVKDVVVNMNLQTSLAGLNINGSQLSNVEVYGGGTSPTSSSGAIGIDVYGYGASIHGCNVHHCRDHGIRSVNGDGCVHTIRDTKIWRNVGNGIHDLNAMANINNPAPFMNNTIDANQGHGIRLDGANGAAGNILRNNNITNHTQASKYGISVATSASDKRKMGWGNNNVWNNTGSYENVTADSTDLAVDPGYANAANGDFTPSEVTLKGAAFPTSVGGTPSEVWIGAIQPVAAAEEAAPAPQFFETSDACVL